MGCENEFKNVADGDQLNKGPDDGRQHILAQPHLLPPGDQDRGAHQGQGAQNACQPG